MRVKAIAISLLFTILPTLVAGVTLDISGLPATQGTRITLRWSGVAPFTLLTFLSTADSPADFQFDSELDVGQNTGVALTVAAPVGAIVRFIVQDSTQEFAIQDVPIQSDTQPLASLSSVSVQSLISIASTISLASVSSTQAAASLIATTSFALATSSFQSSSNVLFTSAPTSVVATSSQVASSTAVPASRTPSTTTPNVTSTGLPQADTAEEKRLNTAAIIGGVLGGLIVAGLIIILIIRCCKRRRDRERAETPGKSALGLTGLIRARTSSDVSSQFARQRLTEKGDQFPSNLQLPDVPSGSRTTWGSRLSVRLANLGRRTSQPPGSNRNSRDIVNWNPDQPHLTPMNGSSNSLGSPFRGGNGVQQMAQKRGSGNPLKSATQRLSGYVPPIYQQFTAVKSNANGPNQDPQRSQSSFAESSRDFDPQTAYAEDAFAERPTLPPKDTAPVRPPRPAKSIDFGATVVGVNGRMVQTTIPAPLASTQDDSSSSRLVGFGRIKRQNSNASQVDVRNISKPMPLQPEARQLAPPPRQNPPLQNPPRLVPRDPFDQPGLPSWSQRNDSRYPTMNPPAQADSNSRDRVLSPRSNQSPGRLPYDNPFVSPPLSATSPSRRDDTSAYEAFGPKPARRPSPTETPRQVEAEIAQYTEDFRPTSLSVIEEITTPGTSPTPSKVNLQSRPPPLTTTGSSSSSNTTSSQVTRTTQATTTGASSVPFPTPSHDEKEDPIPAALPDSFNSTTGFLKIDPSLPPLPPKSILRKKSTGSDAPSDPLTRNSSFNTTTYSHESGGSNTAIRKELLQGVRTALSQKSTNQDLPTSPISPQSVDSDPYASYYLSSAKSNRPLPTPPAAAQSPPETSDRRALESWGMSPSLYNYSSGATGRNYRLSAATAQTSTTSKHLSSQSGRHFSGLGSGEEEWKELERQLKWADGEAHVMPGSNWGSPAPRRLSVMNP